jgi:DeoR/GlpR family transcriptional regulator of sugar metabolism
MLTANRKRHILDLLERDKQVVASAVSEALGVSEDTVRRDLRELAAEGLLRRVHGGALPVALAEVDFTRRQALGVEDKAAIGRFAATLIKPGQVVAIDGGTTAVQLARHLAPDLAATVVTHSPSVAVELCHHARVDVILIGGRLFKHSVVSVGAAAEEAIRRIRADAYFMGVTGVHPEAGLTTGDYEEAAIKRAISACAAETYVLASAEKIGAVSPYQVLPVAAVSGIITTQQVPQKDLDPYEQRGIPVLRAG